MEKLQSNAQAPDCLKCTHYYITHDAQFPYGCRAHGFKSQRKPQLDVLAASHAECLFFAARSSEQK